MLAKEVGKEASSRNCLNAKKLELVPHVALHGGGVVGICMGLERSDQWFKIAGSLCSHAAGQLQVRKMRSAAIRARFAAAAMMEILLGISFLKSDQPEQAIPIAATIKKVSNPVHKP